MSRVNIFEKPASLLALETTNERTFYYILVASRLDQDLGSQVSELAQTAPSADLPEDSEA